MISQSLPIGLGTTETGLLAHLAYDGKPIPYRIKKSRTGHIYNVHRIRKKMAQWKTRLAYRQLPYGGAVRIEYRFTFQIPKSWHKSKKLKAQTHQLPHTDKPDLDNLIKFYNDVIKGIVISDDRQITTSPNSLKQWGEHDLTEIFVYYA